jgi:hypothetical protein
MIEMWKCKYLLRNENFLEIQSASILFSTRASYIILHNVLCLIRSILREQKVQRSAERTPAKCHLGKINLLGAYNQHKHNST